jgi:hypothetical protein
VVIKTDPNDDALEIDVSRRSVADGSWAEPGELVDRADDARGAEPCTVGGMAAVRGFIEAVNGADATVTLPRS